MVWKRKDSTGFIYILYNIWLGIAMRSRFTAARLVLAVVSTSLEEAAIWAIWRFLLPEFDVRLPVGALVGIMVAWGAFSTWLFIFTTRALKKQPEVGLPSMVGALGRVVSRLSPE